MRQGESWAAVRLLGDATGLGRHRPTFVLRGVGLALLSTARMLAATAGRDADGVRHHLTRASGGIGIVRGALGFHYDEYGR